MWRQNTLCGRQHTAVIPLNRRQRRYRTRAARQRTDTRGATKPKNCLMNAVPRPDPERDRVTPPPARSAACEDDFAWGVDLHAHAVANIGWHQTLRAIELLGAVHGASSPSAPVGVGWHRPRWSPQFPATQADRSRPPGCDQPAPLLRSADHPTLGISLTTGWARSYQTRLLAV